MQQLPFSFHSENRQQEDRQMLLAERIKECRRTMPHPLKLQSSWYLRAPLNKSLSFSFFRNDTCDPQKKHVTFIFQFIMKILQTFFIGWNSSLFVFHLFLYLETASGQGYLNSLWVTISKWYQPDNVSLKWLFSFLCDMKDFCPCHCLLLLSPPFSLSLPLPLPPPLLTIG